MSRVAFIRFLNALMAIILMLVICGAFYQQFFRHEAPCPLCLLQRLGMIGVALGALLNMRFGLQTKFFAFSLLSAFFGGFVALRQIALHACPGFPVFGHPVWGLSLYTWSFIVFASCFLGIVFMMFLNPRNCEPTPWNSFEKLACLFVVFITLLNALTTFAQCGLGPCVDVPWPQPSTDKSPQEPTPGPLS